MHCCRFLRSKDGPTKGVFYINELASGTLNTNQRMTRDSLKSGLMLLKHFYSQQGLIYNPDNKNRLNQLATIRNVFERLLRYAEAKADVKYFIYSKRVDCID